MLHCSSEFSYKPSVISSQIKLRIDAILNRMLIRCETTYTSLIANQSCASTNILTTVFMVKNMRITYAEVSLSFPGLVPLVHSSTVWIHPSYLRLVINRCNSVKCEVNAADDQRSRSKLCITSQHQIPMNCAYTQQNE